MNVQDIINKFNEIENKNLEIEIDEDELFNKFGKSEDTNMLAEYLYIKALEKRDT